MNEKLLFRRVLVRSYVDVIFHWDTFLQFFAGCLADTSDPNQVECSIARRGYMDDPMNTDNCWREVELWKIHYSGEETLGEKFQVR
ncbi:hypothetical protein HPB48_019680 [Haemaphysalis longicornis]|uniref:Uncharacterized protein n=1 Tax=Haemaphysalis longicornis TaxID=44386 RepID=A0A9J6G464_HAELO|nr:hypothetical protein HPB48_019680 [Haemaphysalis longicornis]